MLGLKLFPHLYPSPHPRLHFHPDTTVFETSMQISQDKKAADRMELLCNCNRGPKPAFLAQTKFANAHGVFHSASL